MIQQLQKLRNENLRLQEIKGKAYWSLKGLGDKTEAQKAGRVDGDITFGTSSCSSSYGSSIFQDLFQSDAWKDGNISKSKLIKLLESGFKSSVLIRSHTSEILSKDEGVTEILDEQREVAISRSLFSTLLSLLVGVIIWEAEKPHMCLVVALLFVVSISLKSVVEFFTTIRNKPALDAVALLSFNWFVLGILAYPTLPNIACLLAPLASRFIGQMVEWFGFFTS